VPRPRVTGTETLGDLRAAPHHVHLSSPQEPSSWFLWILDISALRASSRRLLALGGRLRQAQVTCSGRSAHQPHWAWHRSARPRTFSFLTSMYRQISATGAHTPPR